MQIFDKQPVLSNLEKLPKELIFSIFSQVTAKDLVNLYKSSKHLQNFSNERKLWENLLQRDFPPLVYQLYAAVLMQALAASSNDLVFQDQKLHPKTWYARTCFVLTHGHEKIKEDDTESWRLLLAVDFPATYLDNKSKSIVNFKKIYNRALILLKESLTEIESYVFLMLQRNNINELKKIIGSSNDKTDKKMTRDEFYKFLFKTSTYFPEKQKLFLDAYAFFVFQYCHPETVSLCYEQLRTDPEMLQIFIGGIFYFERIDIIKLFIEKTFFSVDLILEGNSILKVAIKKQKWTVVKYLVERGAILEADVLNFAVASLNLEIITFLFTKGMRIEKQQDLLAVAINAVTARDETLLPVIELLEKHGAQLIPTDEIIYKFLANGWDKTLAHFLPQHVEKFREILARKAERPWILNGIFSSQAIANCVQLLLQSNIDITPESLGYFEKSALHQALTIYTTITAPSLDYIKLILRHCKNVNVTDKKGETPLFAVLDVFSYANEAVFKEIIILLMAHGANPHLKNKKGETVYTYNSSTFVKHIREIEQIRQEWYEAINLNEDDHRARAERLLVRFKIVFNKQIAPIKETYFSYDNEKKETSQQFLSVEKQFVQSITEKIASWETAVKDANFPKTMAKDLEEILKLYPLQSYKKEIISCKNFLQFAIYKIEIISSQLTASSNLSEMIQPKR